MPDFQMTWKHKSKKLHGRACRDGKPFIALLLNTKQGSQHVSKSVKLYYSKTDTCSCRPDILFGDMEAYIYMYTRM